MAKSASPQLGALVRQLQSERQSHVDATATIDATCQELGIELGRPARRGRPPGRPPGRSKAAAKKAPRATKRKRRKFKQTGEELVLSVVKQKPGITSAQINAQWRKQGRAASADTTLSKLVKDKKLKRQNIKGARGSRYTVA